MPSYTFECKSCNTETTRNLTFAQYKDFQSGNTTIPCTCSNALVMSFRPTTLTFGLKEGQSGGWVTKALKEKSYRAQRNQVVSQRQRDHVNPNKLVPNYNGQEGRSWSEVQDHVRAEKGELAASTYNELVSNE